MGLMFMDKNLIRNEFGARPRAPAVDPRRRWAFRNQQVPKYK